MCSRNMWPNLWPYGQDTNAANKYYLRSDEEQNKSSLGTSGTLQKRKGVLFSFKQNAFSKEYVEMKLCPIQRDKLEFVQIRFAHLQPV